MSLGFRRLNVQNTYGTSSSNLLPQVMHKVSEMHITSSVQPLKTKCMKGNTLHQRVPFLKIL